MSVSKMDEEDKVLILLIYVSANIKDETGNAMFMEIV